MRDSNARATSPLIAAFIVILTASLVTVPTAGWAQAPAPPARLQPIVVTPACIEQQAVEAPLTPYTVVDLQFSRPITKWGEIFVAFENILGETYAVQRTTDGVVTAGNPRLIRGGVRLTY